jgi:ABC-type transport system involved in multi-copper enzyme maturation permease subunit
MLGFCVLLIVLAVHKVRAVTVAERADIKGGVRRLFTRSSKVADPVPSDNTLRTVFPENRNPVACKELRKVGLWCFGSTWRKYILAAGISLLYGGIWFLGQLHEEVIHGVIVELLVLYGIVQIATFSARAIVTEKEGRTWIPLLTTPLSDRQIISGKMEAVLRRTIPVWLWLAIHVIVFVLIGPISPIALITIPLIVIPVIVLLMGLGLYFSTRLRSSTAAVVVTYVIPLALWFICPCIASFSPLFWLPMSLFVDVKEVLAVIYSSGEVLIFPAICLVQLIIALATGLFLLKRARKRIRLLAFDKV